MGRRSAQPEWTNTHDRSLEKVLLENDCELAPLTGKPVKDIEPLFAPFPSAKLNAKIKQLRAMLQSRTRKDRSIEYDEEEGSDVTPLNIGAATSSKRTPGNSSLPSPMAKQERVSSSGHGDTGCSVQDIVYDFIPYKDPEDNSMHFAIVAKNVAAMDMRGQVSSDGCTFAVSLTERPCNAENVLDPEATKDVQTLLRSAQSKALMGHYATKEQRTSEINIPLSTRVYPQAVRREVDGDKLKDVVVQVVWDLTVRTEAADTDTMVPRTDYCTRCPCRQPPSGPLGPRPLGQPRP